MLRYGLIGAGGVGGIHARWAARHPNVELCAISDPNSDRGNALAGSSGVPTYANYREMLAQENLDFVSIATPHDALVSIGLDCLSAGCHLLVEKPLARHIGEAKTLCEEANTRKLQIGVLYQYRNFATPRLIASIIQSGAIGDVRNISWNWHELRPQSYYSQAPWKGNWEGAGGGLLMNQLIHDLDLLRWFAGDVETVQAILADQEHDTRLEDAVSANLRFKNGALASISASINHSRAQNYRAIRGTKGLIVLPDAKSLSGDPDDKVLLGSYSDSIDTGIRTYQGDHQQSGISWTTLQSQPQSLKRILPSWVKQPLKRAAGLFRKSDSGWPVGQRPENGHGASIWDFIDAISAGNPVPEGMSGTSALKTLELANAMIASGIEKREIPLPLDAEAYAALFGQLVSGEVGLNSSSA